MSLRVWLPLTKDLRQQGLDNVTVTNNGATYSSTGGKLGGCYSFDGSDDFISLNGSTLYNIIQGGSTPFSIVMWVYRADSTRAVLFGDYSLSGGIGFNIELSTAHKLRFYWNGSPDVNTSAVCTLSTWSHVAIVYDGTKICFYVNGSLDYTYTVTLSTKTKTSGMYYIGRDARTGTTAFNGKLNDFRIYDHALSQMEVKELAKGLVLHYPLSDNYIEATTNLVTREDGLSDTCYNGATSKYSYGTNTDMYKTIGTFEGRKCTKVYMGTAGLSAYPYVYFDAFNASGASIQTLSFDYFPTLQNTIIPYSYNSAYNFSYTTNNGASGSAINVSQIIIPVEVGKWNHITITAQKNDTTNTTRGIGYIRIGSTSHTSTTSNYWLFGNVQVEAKDHATGYAGVGGTRTPTTVYDCSGFVNNGTISGSLVISDDTPKYQVSTVFGGSQYITEDNEIETTDSTIAVWVKTSLSANAFILDCRNSSGAGKQPIYQYKNGSIQSGGASQYVTTSTGLLVADMWIHLAIVQSGSSLLVYKNGSLFQTLSCTNSSIIKPTIGARYSLSGLLPSGNLSDLRIYATALSADDVKSLYQNCATIDPDGTIRGQIRS